MMLHGRSDKMNERLQKHDVCCAMRTRLVDRRSYQKNDRIEGRYVVVRCLATDLNLYTTFFPAGSTLFIFTPPPAITTLRRCIRSSVPHPSAGIPGSVWISADDEDLGGITER